MNVGQFLRYVGQLTGWAGQHADSLKLTGVAIGVGLLVAVSYRRSGRVGQDGKKPDTSKRLLPLSIACTTGMSAQGMWTVATNALHQTGIVRIALFAFAEIALLTAAAAAGEALARLRELLKHPPADDASEGDRALYEADKAAATRKAKLFTTLVWIIAIGAGLAAQSIGTDLTERGVRMFPALLVAAFWYAQLDRSGLAVSRETITSRVSYKRMMVLLRLADPGTIGLGDVDRRRRLDRLVKALHRYHRVHGKAWAPIEALADWQVDRAEQAAIRHMDGTGMAYVQGRLSIRYNLRTATTAVALRSANPWQAILDSGQVTGQFLEAGQRSAVSGQRSGDRSAVSPVSGQSGTDRSAVSLTAGQRSAVSAELTGQSPVSGQRSAVSLTGQSVSEGVAELTAGQRSAVSGQSAAVEGEVIEKRQPALTGQPDRSAVSSTGQRSAVSPEEMVEFLDAWLTARIEAGELPPGRIPGRPTVTPVLRDRFGSCSTDVVGKIVLPLLRELRAQQQANPAMD